MLNLLVLIFIYPGGSKKIVSAAVRNQRAKTKNLEEKFKKTSNDMGRRLLVAMSVNSSRSGAVLALAADDEDAKI